LNQKVPISPKIAAEVLFLNRHTCCICHDEYKDVEIHHIDGDNSNNLISNLAVVCSQHHSDVESDHGLGRSYSEEEIKKYKADWEEYCKTANKEDKRAFSKRPHNRFEKLPMNKIEFFTLLSSELLLLTREITYLNEMYAYLTREQKSKTFNDAFRMLHEFNTYYQKFKIFSGTGLDNHMNEYYKCVNKSIRTSNRAWIFAQKFDRHNDMKAYDESEKLMDEVYKILYEELPLISSKIIEEIRKIIH
jgi:hypothetical protein